MRWLDGITNGQESEQTPGDGEGQGSLVCCSPKGCRVRHDLVTERQMGNLRKELLKQKWKFQKLKNKIFIFTSIGKITERR